MVMMWCACILVASLRLRCAVMSLHRPATGCVGAPGSDREAAATLAVRDARRDMVGGETGLSCVCVAWSLRPPPSCVVARPRGVRTLATKEELLSSRGTRADSRDGRRAACRASRAWDRLSSCRWEGTRRGCGSERFTVTQRTTVNSLDSTKHPRLRRFKRAVMAEQRNNEQGKPARLCSTTNWIDTQLIYMSNTILSP
jgi:hypothetical protein